MLGHIIHPNADELVSVHLAKIRFTNEFILVDINSNLDITVF